VKARVLPILNAIGCIVLTGVILLQWKKERALDSSLVSLRSQLTEARELATRESSRAANLERDIIVLKESIEAIQKSAEATNQALSKQQIETSGLTGEINAAREQILSWQTAIAERDEKIRSLNSEITATRKRLDEAIRRLKSTSNP
jgi:chromosome segregation ATPase